MSKNIQILPLSIIKIDGGTQPRAELNMNTVQEYADAMLWGDIFPPVIVFHDGAKYWLADGFHRFWAKNQIEDPEIAAEIKDGTRRDAILYSVQVNANHGLRRTNADKRKAVKTLLEDEEWQQWSDREIARRCKVDNSFVSRMRRTLTVDGQQLESSERTYTDKHGNTSTMNTKNIGKPNGDIFGKSGEYVTDEVEDPNERQDTLEDGGHRTIGTGNNEWYTPPEYIDLAKEVMGSIDCDPATTEFANEYIQAETYFTQENTGLNKEWHGNIWMNPPYSQPEIMYFTEKLVEEFQAGRVKQAIMLTHNFTDTRWFHLAAEYAIAVCFTKGRIKFINGQEEKAAPTSGQTFFYFGENLKAFQKMFTNVGLVLIHAE